MSILKVIWLEVAWLEKSGQSRAPSLQINPAAISKTQIDRENKHFDHQTLPKNNMVTTWLLQVLLVGFNFHELDSIFNKNRCEVFPKSWRYLHHRRGWRDPLGWSLRLGRVLVFYVGVCTRSPVVKTGFGTLKALNLTNYNRSPETFYCNSKFYSQLVIIWNCAAIGLIHRYFCSTGCFLNVLGVWMKETVGGFVQWPQGCGDDVFPWFGSSKSWLQLYSHLNEVIKVLNTFNGILI